MLDKNFRLWQSFLFWHFAVVANIIFKLEFFLSSHVDSCYRIPFKNIIRFLFIAYRIMYIVYINRIYMVLYVKKKILITDYFSTLSGHFYFYFHFYTDPIFMLDFHDVTHDTSVWYQTIIMLLLVYRFWYFMFGVNIYMFNTPKWMLK